MVGKNTFLPIVTKSPHGQKCQTLLWPKVSDPSVEDLLYMINE